MTKLLHDVRLSARALLRQPGFSLIALATLSIAIGANTALFGVINGVLLRPLPYPDSSRLVMLAVSAGQQEVGNTNFATVTDWRQRNSSFEEVAAVSSWSRTLTGQGDAEMINGLRVSANYFRTLGVSPLLGRAFEVAEDRPDARFVVALSHGLWQRRFGGDRDIIGKQVELTGRAFTVVAVMPPEFEDLIASNLYKPAEIWAPLGYDAAQPFACRTCDHLKSVARLKPGVSLETARAEMNQIAGLLQAEYPQEYPEPPGFVTGLQDVFVGRIRPALWILFGAVGLVLLIACVNVANLMLARANQRRREMAIRAAMGAGRAHIASQLLLESALLAAVSCAAGWLIAVLGTKLLVSMSPPKMHLQQVALDWRVLLFAALIAALTCLVFACVPALRASRVDLNLALRHVGSGWHSRRDRRLRGLLVIAELSLAVVLLVGAGLLIRSFTRLLEVAPGFESGSLLTMTVPAAGLAYREEERIRSFYRELIASVQTLPGVTAVGIVSNLPLGGNMDSYGFHVEEKPLPNPALAPSAERYGVSPDYFRAMGIPLIRGRLFEDRDSASGPLVVTINQTAVRRIWGDEDPLGKRIRLGGPDGDLRTIVGIVGDVNHYGLDTAPEMQVYVPHAQWTDSFMQLAIRTTNDPRSSIDAVREVVRSVDRDVPVYDVATMQQLVSNSMAQRRFTLALLSVFSAVALLLAAVGVYGVISYSVTQRTEEIGIRMAVGATRLQVFRLIVGEGALLTGWGLALGLAAALAATRLMESLLFGTSATDAVTFLAACSGLICVGLVACLVPAQRATRVDPIRLLRRE
jgi:putative ABC transport system permease protein